MKPAPPLELLSSTHQRAVHERRVRKLAEAITPLLRPGWRVIDVGCGDGRLGALLAERAQVELEGFELQPRAETLIPVRAFDGEHLPLADGSCDAVLLVDVLHHARDPRRLLAEARRVAREAVIVKDHRKSRPFAHATLLLMDWVGNRPHGVALPSEYWTEERWRATWGELGLRADVYRTRLDLYAGVARWAFESGLQFLARLVPEPASRTGR